MVLVKMIGIPMLGVAQFMQVLGSLFLKYIIFSPFFVEYRVGNGEKSAFGKILAYVTFHSHKPLITFSVCLVYTMPLSLLFVMLRVTFFLGIFTFFETSTIERMMILCFCFIFQSHFSLLLQVIDDYGHWIHQKFFLAVLSLNILQQHPTLLFFFVQYSSVS